MRQVHILAVYLNPMHPMHGASLGPKHARRSLQAIVRCRLMPVNEKRSPIAITPVDNVKKRYSY